MRWILKKRIENTKRKNKAHSHCALSVDGCGKILLHGTNPREKNTVTFSVAKMDYKGKTMLCPQCKFMLAVIEKPKVARGYVAR